MDSGNHPDPVSEAMSHGLQRAVQVASSVMTGAQIYVHLKRIQARVVAERDRNVRRALAAQISGDSAAARASWAPALDPDWLRQASLFQAAQAWGAAMPYADRAVPWYEPAAAAAMRVCEERLRDLHPHAMARYDRLRRDGTGPADAMREAAALFGQAPTAHDAAYQARPVLDAGNGESLTRTTAGPEPGPVDPASPATGVAQERPDRPSARPWQHDFPMPVRDVVASAASRGPAAGQPAAAAPARQAGRRSGPRP